MFDFKETDQTVLANGILTFIFHQFISSSTLLGESDYAAHPLPQKLIIVKEYYNPTPARL